MVTCTHPTRSYCEAIGTFGLMKTFIPEFQLEAMEKNSTTLLFKTITAKLKTKSLATALNIDLTMDSNSYTEED
jgi:hypothetical protein